MNDRASVIIEILTISTLFLVGPKIMEENKNIPAMKLSTNLEIK